MIITRTPYRLSFFGGGTDYNPWFEKNGGLVVGTTFNKYCWISLRKLPPFFNHKTRVAYSQSEMVDSNQNIKHPGVRSCLEYLKIDDGLEIHHDGDLPARSGIGSSSSFSVGFLLALHAFQNRMISKLELAKQAIHVEQNVERQNVGIQDQIFASFGGLQIIEIPAGKQFEVRPLILEKSYKNHLQNHIMLAFSGFTRSASESAKSQIQNIEQGRCDSQLNEMMSLCREAIALLANQADMSQLGKMFHHAWMIKRKLSTTVTNDSIDDIYNRAISAGAYGGRLLGAGQGGFFMFLAPPEIHDRVRAALPEIKVWVPFEFEDEGAKVILYGQ